MGKCAKWGLGQRIATPDVTASSPTSWTLMYTPSGKASLTQIVKRSQTGEYGGRPARFESKGHPEGLCVLSIVEVRKRRRRLNAADGASDCAAHRRALKQVR